jgi:hypothetical protein
MNFFVGSTGATIATPAALAPAMPTRERKNSRRDLELFLVVGIERFLHLPPLQHLLQLDFRPGYTIGSVASDD